CRYGEHNPARARMDGLGKGAGWRARSQQQEVRVACKSGGRAEPSEIAWIELGIGIRADKPNQRHVASEQPERRPIAPCNGIEIIDRTHAAGAGHVLRHDGRIASDITPEMTCDEPRDHVIAAAWTVADDQVDLPAAVELLD